MSRTTSCAAILILFGVIFSSSVIGHAQGSQNPRKVTVKKNGWLIPGRDNFKQVSKVLEKNIEGIDVTQKILEATEEVIVDGEGRSVKPLGERKPNVQLFSVRGFSVYESDGRVFAYGVALVPVFFERGKKYTQKMYAGAMYNLFHVDEDGDGIFEARYAGLPLRELPDWLRRHV